MNDATYQIRIYAQNQAFGAAICAALSPFDVALAIENDEWRNLETDLKTAGNKTLAVIAPELITPDLVKKFASFHTGHVYFLWLFAQETSKEIENECTRTGMEYFFMPTRIGRIADTIKRRGRDLQQADFKAEILLPGYIFTPTLCLLKSESGDMIRMTEKERDILLLLYKTAPKSVGKQELLDSVWQYADGVETHTLETHIYRLRRKIEQDPSKPNILVTDETGYKLLI